MGIRVLLTKVFAVLSLIFLSFGSTAFAFSANGDDPYYLLRAGKRIKLKLDAPVNSRFSSKDDTFIAVVTEPVRNGGRIVLDEGVRIEGRIVRASPNGPLGKAGELEVEFFRIMFDGGDSRRISGKLAKPLKARSKQGWQLASLIGGTLGGVLIGALAGGGKTAAIGGGIGAAAGGGTAAAINGDDVGINAGDQFEMVLQHDVALPFDEV
jgi:hypothetical protein